MKVSGFPKCEKQVTNFSPYQQKAQKQNTTDKDQWKDVTTAFSVQNTESQKSILNYVKEHEKLVADVAAVYAQFRRYRAYVDTKHGRLQTCLHG